MITDHIWKIENKKLKCRAISIGPTPLNACAKMGWDIKDCFIKQVQHHQFATVLQGQIYF